VNVGILSYRLYHYRREFARLVAVRNTTKSRFIRLFVICLIIITIYVPYTIWLLVVLCRAVVDPYSWSRVHDPQRFNTIVKAPSFGQVTVDRWGEVVSGYIVFFVFGTGSDAHNMYKKMLLAIGLGKIFSRLYVVRDSGNSTPNSFIVARTWTSNLSSKAKSMFWSRTNLVISTFDNPTRNNSVALDSVQRLRSVSNEVLAIEQREAPHHSLFARIFFRKTRQQPVLPLFEYHPHCLTETSEIDLSKSLQVEMPHPVSQHATWPRTGQLPSAQLRLAGSM
jgi:pheromone a factor receptor